MVGVTLVLVVAWRVLALGDPGEPVGVDLGNWLRVVESWSGHVDIADVVYPPVVPALAGGLRWMVGVPLMALVLPAVAGLAPGLGVWATVRSFVGPWWAGLAGLAVATSTSTSAAVAWGGVPQLVALGMWPVVTLAACRWVQAAGRRDAVAVAVWLVAIGWTSALVFAAAVLSVAVTIMVAAVSGSTSGWSRHAWWLLLAVPVLAVVYVPLGTTMSVPAGRMTEVGPIRAVQQAFDLPVAVVLVLVALAAAGWIVSWRRAGVLWPLMTGLLVAATVGLAVGEVRAAALAPTAVAVAVCGLATEVGRHRLLPVAGAAVVGVLVAVAPVKMRDQVDHYHRFSPVGTLAATRWLAEQERGEGLVIAAPVDGVPTGWWVEAAGIDALVAADDDWLFFPGERAESHRAVAALTGEAWPSPRALAQARACGADWLYLPTGWGGVDRQALAQRQVEHPDLVAFDGAGALILRVPPADALAIETGC